MFFIHFIGESDSNSSQNDSMMSDDSQSSEENLHSSVIDKHEEDVGYFRINLS